MKFGKNQEFKIQQFSLESKITRKVVHMSGFKINKKISLSNCSVTKILQNPYNPTQLISSYFDGSLHIWKLPNLNFQKKIPLLLSKLTTIVPFQNENTRGFLMGIKNGQLSLINENFQLISSKKLHKQSISEIIISNDNIITVGYDGQVLFLDKQTLETVRQIEFEYPLFSAVEYEDKIYIASIKSYVLNKETLKYKEMKRFDKFFVLNNRIYGASDDRGLSCLNSNSNNYLPAQYLLLFQRKIIIFSQKSICVSNQQDKLEYKAMKCSQFSSGESITTGFTCERNVYVGGNEGNIYWISEYEDN